MSGMDERELYDSRIALKLDWQSQTMVLEEVSADMRASEQLQEGAVHPFSPFIYFLEQASGSFMQESEAEAVPMHFLVDCSYGRGQVSLRLHVCNKCAYVVNTSQERLRRALRNKLTPRETDVAVLLFQGNTIRCIAMQLQIAEGTVKRTIYNIYQKLQISSQAELIRKIYALLAQQGGREDAEA